MELSLQGFSVIRGSFPSSSDRGAMKYCGLQLVMAILFLQPPRTNTDYTETQGGHGVGQTQHVQSSRMFKHSEENLTLSDEKVLLHHLLRRYEAVGKGGRPVMNMSQTIGVEFGLGLIQMELDEKSKVFITSMWTRLRWRDVYLTWNPDDFGQVTQVRMEAGHVWIPDIMLYNTADPEGAARNALVVVSFDGTMQWVPHQIFKSSCSIDVTNFPFDRQQCHMWFGSWTHPAEEIDLKLAFPTGIDLSTFKSDYKDSCVWEIVDPVAERRLLPPNDTKPIAVLTFTLHLERKLVFSSYILTLPCVFLASLTLVVFWLPPDRPDRTSLAMSLFASFLVLLLILVESAPPTASSVPTLGVYYCLNMVIIMMSIFLSSMVVNIHRGGQNKRTVPPWLRVIALEFLGRIFCVREAQTMCGASRRYAKSKIVDEDEGGNFSNNSSNRSHPLHHLSLTNRKSSCCSVTTDSWRRIQETHLASVPIGQPQQPCDLHTGLRQLERSCEHLEAQLEDVRKMLERVVVSAHHKDQVQLEYRQVVHEWKLVASALDRFFFVLYLGIIVVSLLTTFPRPPFIMKS